MGLLWRCALPTGRIARLEYNLRLVAYCALWALAYFLRDAERGLVVALTVVWALASWTDLCAQAQRLRDMGRSLGWLIVTSGWPMMLAALAIYGTADQGFPKAALALLVSVCARLYMSFAAGLQAPRPAVAPR